MTQGFALHEIITDKSGNPTDYRFIAVNPAFERLTGLKADEITGRTVLEILPETEKYWIKKYGEVALSNTTAEFENYSAELGRWYDVIAYSPERGQFAVTFTDITAKKEAEKKLRQKNDELIAANSQLAAAEEELRSQMDELPDIQRKLKESEGQFYSIIKEIPISMSIATIKGEILLINSRTAEVLELKSEDINGINAQEFWANPKRRKIWLEEINKTGIVSNFEADIITTSGKHKSLSISGLKIIFEGRPCILSVHQDVTDKKRAESELKLSHEKYRSLIENVSEVIFRLDDDGVITYVSQNITDLTGYQASEMTGRHYTDFVYPKDRPDRINEFNILLAGGKNPTEFRLIKKEGGTVWIRNNGQRIIADGRVTGIQGIITDISGLKAVEEKSKKYAENLELLFNSIEEMVLILDNDGNIIRVNASVERELGYSEEELSGREVLILHPEERRNDVIKNIKDIAAGITDTCNIPLIAKNKRTIEAETKITRGYWDKKAVLVCVTRDVTDRKQAEEALQKSEEQYRTIFDNSPIGIELLDSDGYFINANPACLKIFGIEKSDALSGFFLFSDPNLADEKKREILNGITVRFETAFDFSKVLENNIYPTSKRGIIWLDLLISPLKNEEAMINGYLVQIQDITDRREMREELKKSGEKYRDLADNAPVGILTCDKSGRIIYLNSKVPVILGSPGVNESSGINLLENKNLVASGFSDILRGVLEDKTSISELEMEYISVWGKKVYLRIHATPLRKEGAVDGARIIIDDITKRKLADEALRITNNKLKLLSSITRHDILNQVMVIGGYLDLAERIDMDRRLSKYCDSIRAATDTVQRQIEFTREYDGLGSKEPLWHDISSAICDTAKGRLPVVCECRGLWIYADPMVMRVVYNLYDNALRHADGATEVRVSCRKVELSQSADRSKKRSRSGYLIIYEDDGCGVPDEMKERIFERGVGANTGLGLFLIREILAITGITITETGKYGKGARFEMTVPDGAWRIEKDINTI
ncbi:PAS domain S-box protein [Methanoplanus endosymbiosus]|uniref:histidine kinase n=1 Tax=Methanoplanus endosymbiosus TaxID=33865 RepID=A0A9E7PLU2_9EURY|nr:PAS domain S-box protein [Methanoplanus endosymbiosus]UUX92508.1 PAS domain S-box protein [Methanoplanus endosymbiosus]